MRVLSNRFTDQTDWAEGKDYQLRFHHAGINVPDIEAAIRWYREKLDFVLEQRIELDEPRMTFALIRRGNMRIELSWTPDHKPLPPERTEPHLDQQVNGNKHVAFAVQDVFAAAAALKARGVDVLFVERFEFGACSYFRDNSGNLLEFVEQPQLWDGDRRR